MALVFSGSISDLKIKLSDIQGIWDESNNSRIVFKSNGGLLNWFPTTGTIQFQGVNAARERLEWLVKAALDNSTVPAVAPVVAPVIAPVVAPVAAVTVEKNLAKDFLDDKFTESELVIGIVTAVGTESTRVISTLRDRLVRFGYVVEEIKLSSLLGRGADNFSHEYDRIKTLMRRGDDLRENTKNNAILAYGAAKLISERRGLLGGNPKRAYLINSLKHPDEVVILRRIYSQSFYLFGIHADKKRRVKYLTDDKGLTFEQASELTTIDEDEKIKHGQRTRDTYHLSDFFINFGKNDDQIKNTIQRFLELIFSHPYKNPTFDEFAMFMAFSSSVRSGDLSRQVGAVITKNQQILSTGANECPSPGGGLYWAELDDDSGAVIDKVAGKDYTRSIDSNKAEQIDIINEIVANLKGIEGMPEDKIQNIRAVLEKSRISDLTEFGRVVHAEMEALLSCSRAGTSCAGSTLYCTTFPCHNCAKHIIAAGVMRVIYVEPYPKSKALDFHSDSITLKTQLDEELSGDHVSFEPFTGVGARRFLDFFSMSLGAGNKLKRKTEMGGSVEWSTSTAQLRVPLLPKSYIDIESEAARNFPTTT